MVEKLKRPKLPSPVKISGPGEGKIIVKVSGRSKVVSGDSNTIVERIE